MHELRKLAPEDLPEAQRSGIGGSPMREIITSARARGRSTLLLDASEAGRPLYLKPGFIRDDLVRVWIREGPGLAGRPRNAMIKAPDE